MERQEDYYEIEILESKKVASENYLPFRNNNHNRNYGGENKQLTNGTQAKYTFEDDDDDGILIIDLIDEDKSSQEEDKSSQQEENSSHEDEVLKMTKGEDDDTDSFVNIELERSKQLVMYLSKKPRLYNKCEIKAVSHAALFNTAMSEKPQKNMLDRKIIHYTEKVENRDPLLEGLPNDEKKKNFSGYEIELVDESSLVSSSSFSLNEESGGTLKRSYSIEFINEDISLTAATLKRSYSIEFLNESVNEMEAFSSEVVSYKINKGEGVLVYSDLQMHETPKKEDAYDDNDDNNYGGQNNLNKSYSIEFLDECQDKRSPFSVETISNDVEKVNCKLYYVDTDSAEKKVRRPNNKLKTLQVSIQNDDNEDGDVNQEHNSSYNIEIHDEDDNEYEVEDYGNEDEGECVEAVVHQQQQQPFDYGLTREVVDSDINDDVDDEQNKQTYNIKILDEEDDTRPLFKDNQTSTPTKPSSQPKGVKKSPLQTISIAWEFQKRNLEEEIEKGVIINDTDDYLLYEEDVFDKGRHDSGDGRSDLSQGKLKTIQVDMETHHKAKLSKKSNKKEFQLEFQSEQERRRMSQYNDSSQENTSRLSSDSSCHNSSRKTVSVDTNAEEVIEVSEPTSPSQPLLMKRKWYSVEHLNEDDGDKSVFAEEIADDGKWTLKI
eukprot:gene8025-8884_t